MPTINDHLQQERYRIIDQSGHNETSAVYQAYDNVLKTNVVIKEFLVNLKKVTTLSQQETRRLTFANEAKFLTDIKHESLLQVYNYFSEIDRQYLVMEAVEGESLSQLLLENNEKPFSAVEVIKWSDQLLDALNYLHTHTSPIIHRDVKPQNIKLTSNGKVKLLTTNLTKNFDAKVNKAAATKTYDSSDLNYLPLEQIWDGLDPASQKVILNSYDEKSEKILEQPADAQSDIYALGATLYHLVTGQFPVDALTRSIDKLEGKSDPLLPPAQLNSTIPPEFSNILMKALEIKRENRFVSAIAMRQSLQLILKLIREKELDAQKKQEIAVQETRLAEQKRLEHEKFEIDAQRKRLEQERQIIEQKKLEIENERKRQEDLIKQQLIEAEAQRLKAEQRAAEAEKRLFEKDTQNLLNNDVLELDFNELWENEALAAAPKGEEVITQITQNPKLPPPVQNNIKPENTSDDFEFLSSELPKSNKVWQKMAAVVVLLIVFSGAGWGIWSVMSSKSAAANQITPNQTISSNDLTKPNSTVESATSPGAQSTPETNEMPTNSSPQNAFETSGKETVVKNKSVSQPLSAPAKKQVVATTKPTPGQKKTLTVDDIINDN